LGPTHPATHGVFQNILEMDGERIVSAVPTVGYIHRAFEKIAERRPYYQITPLTDRLNYCSSPINNMGWHITVERLLGIKTPKRVDYLRVIIMELSRIADHLVCNSVIGVDTGALTSFVYVFEFREHIYEIFEAVCGSRLTTNIGRFGGFERNFPQEAFDKTNKFLEAFPRDMKEHQVHTHSVKNVSLNHHYSKLASLQKSSGVYRTLRRVHQGMMIRVVYDQDLFQI
jgi:NADH-quinone oxidoreductase subunit D